MMFEKQGTHQFLAFVLVGKWMKILSHTGKYKSGMGSPVPFSTVEGEPLGNSNVQSPQRAF